MRYNVDYIYIIVYNKGHQIYIGCMEEYLDVKMYYVQS